MALLFGIAFFHIKSSIRKNKYYHGLIISYSIPAWYQGCMNTAISQLLYYGPPHTETTFDTWSFILKNTYRNRYVYKEHIANPLLSIMNYMKVVI